MMAQASISYVLLQAIERQTLLPVLICVSCRSFFKPKSAASEQKEKKTQEQKENKPQEEKSAKISS